MKIKLSKIPALLIIITIITIMLSALSACTPHGGDDGEGTVTVVIAAAGEEKEYKIELSAFSVTEGVFSLLSYLNEHEGIALEAQSGPYGKMLLRLGDIAPAENEYVKIFTSVSEDFDVSVYAESMTYRGTALMSTGVGASLMKVRAGAIYYFTLGSF